MSAERKERAAKHIYVESQVMDRADTQQILKRFPQAEVIEIRHYKDVLNRPGQDFSAQKAAPALILARKEGTLLYPGARMCQSFSQAHFYYASCMINCLYDCAYCYLQGMYPSANIVLFLNLEEVFAQVDELLIKHPVYLCISYDTDLLALESMTGFVQRWYTFLKDRPNLIVEVRTKSGSFDSFADLTPLPNLIFAWTLSPQVVIEKYEHRTASLRLRLNALRQASRQGFPVRLCFDPILYVRDYEKEYATLVRETFAEPISVLDASIGVFRISSTYLKQMRRQRPGCALLYYPFLLEDGAYSYGKELSQKMTYVVKNCLLEYLKEEQIFIWDEEST